VHRKEGRYAILTTRLVERLTRPLDPEVSTSIPSFDLIMTDWKCHRTIEDSLSEIVKVCLSRCKTKHVFNPFPHAEQISSQDRQAKTVSPYRHPFQHIINNDGILAGAEPMGQWFVLLLRSHSVFRAAHPGSADQHGSCLPLRTSHL